MFGFIYIITNTVNNKVYIGQTIRTIEDRWREHCRNKCHEGELNMLIKKAIRKYGKDKFSISVLERCKVEDLNEKEIYYISLYDSYNKGYNQTKGGTDGAKPLKLNKEQQKSCLELYKFGFSLRSIAKEFNVDKATIKHIVEISSLDLRTTRTYKLTQEDRIAIIEDSKFLSRKEIMNKWNISKSYLSQLINGKRRI